MSDRVKITLILASYPSHGARPPNAVPGYMTENQISRYLSETGAGLKSQGHGLDGARVEFHHMNIDRSEGSVGNIRTANPVTVCVHRDGSWEFAR